MGVYGLTRASSLKQEASPKVQEAAILECAAGHGFESVTMLHEPLGTSGKTTKFAERPQGKWILENLSEGDVLIVERIDRLGRRLSDSAAAVETLDARKIGIIGVREFNGQLIDTRNAGAQLLVHILLAFAVFENTTRTERTVNGKNHRIELGIYCQNPNYGQRKVIGPDGHPMWEWDDEQLKIMVEVAARLARGVRGECLLIELQARGLKDHRGLPWGLVVPRNGHSPKKPEPNSRLYKANRQLFKYQAAGELPEPWNTLTLAITQYRRCKEKKRWNVKNGTH